MKIINFPSVNLIILTFLTSTPVKGYIPAGYVGCFKDHRWRILNGEQIYSAYNSGDSCKQYCISHGYRYAGTENGNECFCGNTIREKEQADNCNHRCPGNQEEHCGGSWRISVYDTWPCSTHPCKNGASCKDLRWNQYRCSCTYEWTGLHCDIKKQTTTVKPSRKTTRRLTSITSPPPPTKTATRPTSTITIFRSTSATTTTRLLKSTKSLSDRTDKSSAAYVKTSEGNKHEITKGIRATTTGFPNKRATDDPSSLLISIYIILPLGLIIMLMVIAVFLKRRCQRKKEALIETMSHGPGSVANIYANLTVSNNNRSEQRKTSHSSRNKEVLMSNILRADVDKEQKGSIGQETGEYNTIVLGSNAKLVHKNSYDHVAKATDSVERSYSHISAMHRNNKQTDVNNSYSHIPKASWHNYSGVTEKTDDTYNVLQLKANTPSGKYCGKIDEYSEYNQTDTTVTEITREDDYSHLNTTAPPFNANHESSVVDENIYYNDNVYATVQKAFKYSEKMRK